MSRTCARLDEAGLLYIEQPLPRRADGPRRAVAGAPHAHLRGRNAARRAAAREIAELGGPRVWNVKVHRMAGSPRSGRVVCVAREFGAELWAAPCPSRGWLAGALAARPAGFVYHRIWSQRPLVWPEADVIELRMTPDGRMAVLHVDRRRLDGAVFRRASRRLH